MRIRRTVKAIKSVRPGAAPGVAHRRRAHGRATFAAVLTGVLAGAMAASPATWPTPPAHAAATVTVTTLSLPIGSDYGGRGVAINDNGQIAGWSSEVLYGRDVPFEFRNAEYWGPGGGQIDLNPPLVLSSQATLLNRNGLVAGQTNKDVVAWKDHVPAYLAPFACMGPPHCTLHSVAINDNDQVAVTRKLEATTPTCRRRAGRGSG